MPWLWFFLCISPPVARRDSSGSKIQLTFQPPCVFMAPLPLSLEASCLLLNWPVQGGLWGTGRPIAGSLWRSPSMVPRGCHAFLLQLPRSLGRLICAQRGALPEGPFRGLKWCCFRALDRRCCSHRISHVSRVSPSSSAFPIALPACRGLTSPALSSGPRRELGPCTCCGSAACGRCLVSGSSCGPWSLLAITPTETAWTLPWRSWFDERSGDAHSFSDCSAGSVYAALLRTSGV